MKDGYIIVSLHHSYISLQRVGRILNLGVNGLIIEEHPEGHDVVNAEFCVCQVNTHPL